MKPVRPNLLQSLVKAAVNLLAIVAVALLAVPNAQSQQKPDEKNQPAGTKKPEAQKPSDVKKPPELPYGLKAMIEIGGEDPEVRGDRPGKFEQYRDYPRNFFIRNLLL